jgi:hypothetical protein
VNLDGIEHDAIEPPAPLLEAVRRLSVLCEIDRGNPGVPTRWCVDSDKFDPAEVVRLILDDEYMEQWLSGSGDYLRKWFFRPTRTELDGV